MKSSLSLISILEAAPPWPAGSDHQIVTLSYATPNGWSYLTHLRIERRADKSLALCCPWCGEHCTALYHDAVRDSLRCEANGKRSPSEVLRADKSKVRRKGTRKAA